MDPSSISTIATTAAGLLFKYLKKSGDEASDEAGRKAGAEVFNVIKEKILRTEADETLGNLIKNVPEDVLRNQIEEMMKSDETFAKKIDNLNVSFMNFIKSSGRVQITQIEKNRGHVDIKLGN